MLQPLDRNQPPKVHRLRWRKRSGHSLLEALVATGVFILVAVALSGVWVMYGKGLAKSGEYVAANQLARAYTEGLIANGYDWLKSRITNNLVPAQESYTIKRRVRSRTADIQYNIAYDLALNTDPDPDNQYTGDRPLMAYGPEDLCRITVLVRWHSANGKETYEGGKYNNQLAFITYAYKYGIKS